MPLWIKWKRFVPIPIALCGIFAAFVVYASLFGAPERNAELERFIIPIGQKRSVTIEKLAAGGFVKHARAFGLLAPNILEPGGYKISKAMNARQISKVFAASPYMKWVVIPEGYRKEEIAAALVRALGWSASDKDKWLNTYTAMDADHIEGVYFPETYLISKDEVPLDVAKRLRSKFEEKFATYAKEAVARNIKWTTLLKIASIVQREAAGKSDMSIVAAVIWNRLDVKMRLNVDATLQYAKGNEDIGWWPPVDVDDKLLDSPFNSYRYDGLPPTPIANPGLDAIDAALHPAKTNCLYYLHDSDGKIYCARSYAEHQFNIEKYLK